MIRLRGFIRKYPIAASILLAVVFDFIHDNTGNLFYLISGEETIGISYAREIYGILWPLLLVWITGYIWIYKSGGFLKTLFAGLIPVLFYGLTFIGRILLPFINPNNIETWRAWYEIVLGVLILFGVGFREESVYRGIVSNLIGEKYVRSRKGLMLSVFLSGLIFGFMHISNVIAVGWGNFPNVLWNCITNVATGMMLTAIYYRGGNIWLLIMIHALMDGVAAFQALFVLQDGVAVDLVEVVGSQTFTPGSLISPFLGLIITFFLLRKNKAEEVIGRYKLISSKEGENYA